MSDPVVETLPCGCTIRTHDRRSWQVSNCYQHTPHATDAPPMTLPAPEEKRMGKLLTMAQQEYDLNMPLNKSDTQRIIEYRLEISAQRAEVARLSDLVQRVTQERDSWHKQFETLRVSMGWAPSEQAHEIMRLRQMLDEGAAKIARAEQAEATLRQREEQIRALPSPVLYSSDVDDPDGFVCSWCQARWNGKGSREINPHPANDCLWFTAQSGGR